ncbi:MAG: DEAD/DEAH box helicase [Rectinemataceae bacterium]
MIELGAIAEYLANFLPLAVHEGPPKLSVLAGFPVDELEIAGTFLFSKRCKTLAEYLDGTERRRMVSEAITRGNGNVDCWCTIEDFLLLDANVIKDFFDIRFIKLPIYKNLLPLDVDLGTPSEGAHGEEEDCATECLTPVFFDDEISRGLDSRIGQVFRNGDSYWFAIPFPIDWEDIAMPFKAPLASATEIEEEFTITEDEGSWILLCREFWQRIPDGVHIGIFISNESLKESYSRLIRNLSSLARNAITQVYEEAPSSRKHGYAIETVLKRYWGVPSFRDFLVYHNVRGTGDISVEEVSQSDVIDDIMTQVDNAQAGRSYRDIFVTAPTGSGKSVMFQIPSIVLHEKGMLTLVISPLIALMNDQVYSLVGMGLGIAATINSSVSISEKEVIISHVQSGDVSVLYLSPESLLSRSDIKSLIGERTVGLLVVDEAHIVTTWGKAFRPDYWYLGNYIQRLRKERHFPIATFTATAIYRGPEDMYSETRDSLGMRDPITYFGYIPRKNIDVSFEKSLGHASAKTNEYNDVKFSVLASRLEEFKREGNKALVYFPFVSLINDFDVFLASHDTGLSPADMVQYHGGMGQFEKKESFQKYKANLCRIMLATKAFGMGIDIPDIDVVYHFAPTGNVCDYVQEIGRAARDERVQGLAKFDYLEKDFSFVNRLHGISTIRKSQLLAVMTKLLDIGRANDYRRNLLVSSDDFHLIFDEGGRYSDKDSDSLDNKLKTALLIIEKDMVLKLGYSPILARPRALFTYAYFKGEGEQVVTDLRSVFGRWSEDLGECFKVNLKAFWEDRHPNYSFARLKYELYSDPQHFGFSRKENLIPVIIIDIATGGQSDGISQEGLIDCIVSFCDGYAQSGRYFKIQLLEGHLIGTFPGLGAVRGALLAETILNFLDVWNRSISLNGGRFLSFREDLGYRIIGTSYVDIRDFCRSLDLTANRRLYMDSSPMRVYHLRRIFAVLGLLDAADCLTYTVQGGENPEIFVRINSYYQIQNIARDFSGYDNLILKNVKARHENSVKFLDYLFTHVGERTDRFWAFIECYFLGMQPDLEQDIDQDLPRIEKTQKPNARLIARQDYM